MAIDIVFVVLSLAAHTNSPLSSSLFGLQFSPPRVQQSSVSCRRLFENHKHKIKHIQGAASSPERTTTVARSSVDPGKISLAMETANIARLQNSDSKQMKETLTSLDASMASKVGSSPASTPLDHGKLVVSGIAYSTPSTLPPNSGSAEQMAKTASSISYNQQLKQQYKSQPPGASLLLYMFWSSVLP